MRARAAILVTTLLVARGAHAELVKSGGAIAAKLRGLLAVEMRDPERAGAGRVARDAWGSCTASVIDLPGVGPRVVTARHCRGAALRVRDESATREATGRLDASGGVDVSILDAGPSLPWDALPARASATVAPGERLCAVRVETTSRGLFREPICARVLHTLSREGEPPLLVLGHPFPHGTSGSPLLDAEGRAVGVVVATTDVAGFAEPIEAVVAVARAPR